MATGNFFKHWPTMLLGVVVAVILLIAVFSYQLNQTESAVVTTFGSPAAVTDPGLHFRWPFPFQKIYKFDHRIRCFEGGSGKIEETMTADGQNILVGIFINYRISAVEKFFRTLEDMTKAEERLNSLMRSAKNATFGQYKFSQVINTKPELMKLNEIQDRIKAALEKDTAEYGIEIVDGVLTENYVAPVVMSGYVPDLLKSISMVSGDMEIEGSGMCGKGYKEWVRVSDGGPCLKARIKLG